MAVVFLKRILLALQIDPSSLRFSNYKTFHSYYQRESVLCLCACLYTKDSNVPLTLLARRLQSAISIHISSLEQDFNIPFLVQALSLKGGTELVSSVQFLVVAVTTGFWKP